MQRGKLCKVRVRIIKSYKNREETGMTSSDKKYSLWTDSLAEKCVPGEGGKNSEQFCDFQLIQHEAFGRSIGELGACCLWPFLLVSLRFLLPGVHLESDEKGVHLNGLMIWFWWKVNSAVYVVTIYYVHIELAIIF